MLENRGRRPYDTHRRKDTKDGHVTLTDVKTPKFRHKETYWLNKLNENLKQHTYSSKNICKKGGSNSLFKNKQFVFFILNVEYFFRL